MGLTYAFCIYVTALSSVGLLTVGTGAICDTFTGFWDPTPPYWVTLLGLNTWGGAYSS